MTIETMVSDFLAGEITKMPPVASFSDLPEVIKDVTAADLVLYNATGQEKTAEVFAYLKGQIPHNDVLDAGLSVSVAPSRSKSEDMRFLWSVRVAQNPLHVLTLMQLGQLASFDVKVLQDLYPEVYQEITNALIIGIVGTYTPEQQIPRQIKMMSSIYLQIPVINAKTLQAYKEKPKENPSKAPSVAQSEQGA